MGNITESTSHVLCFMLFTFFPTLFLSAFLLSPSFSTNICTEGENFVSWKCNPPSNTVVNALQVRFKHENYTVHLPISHTPIFPQNPKGLQKKIKIYL